MRGGRLGPGTAVLALVVACGGEPEPEVPSRDWSGRYGARVVEATTDCMGAEEPPPLTGLIVQVLQTPANEGLVTLGPFIQLRGPMEEDRLAARARVQEPIALPESIAARAAPADSLDVISYRFEVAFADSGFAGTYEVHSPDVRALARDTVGGRCAYVYRLAGRRLPGEAGELVEPGPDEPPGAVSPGAPAGSR